MNSSKKPMFALMAKRGSLFFLMALMLAPISWMLLLSFKRNSDLMRGTQYLFSSGFTVDNYYEVMLMSSLPTWIINSTIVSLSSTVLVLTFSSLAAYGFSRTEFRGRSVLSIFTIVALIIPEQSLIIARFEMFRNLGLHNSYSGLIAPHLSGALGTYYITQYFLGIPREITDAAIMDGVDHFEVFLKVMMPLAFPALAIVGMCTFIAAWNDYWWPLLSSTMSDRLTLTVGLAGSQKLMAQTNGLGYLMAQGIVACVPSFVLYCLFQRYIISAAASAS